MYIAATCWAIWNYYLLHLTARGSAIRCCSLDPLGDQMILKKLEPRYCTTNGTTVRRIIHCSIPYENHIE